MFMRKICLGLGELELGQSPTDQQIGRLVSGLRLEVVKELFLYLEMPVHEWEDLQNNYSFSEDCKFFALWKWKQKEEESTFLALKNTLTRIGEDHHKLCEVSI